LIEDAVRRANGNFGLALQTMQQDEQDALNHFELFTGFMRLCYGQGHRRPSIEWVENVSGPWAGKSQKQLIDYSLRLLRENFMLNLENRTN
jgi:hypothetical protein